MLWIRRSGASEWLEFSHYDDSGRVTLQAEPSAITGYDEGYADLLHEVDGVFEYLRDDAGLIHTWSYHAPTGWIAAHSIQEGQAGDPVLLLEKEYVCCHSGCGCGSSSSSSSSGSGEPARWLPAKETIFPSDTDPEVRIETSYSYSFYEGTCAVKEKVTTLPVVSEAQNGSGVAATRREYFDEYGNLTWSMDERGFITRMKYDIPTGAITQQIQDVDTSMETDAPDGWETPSGGGLNLVTDFEHDDQGRITQVLGPSHSMDLDGSATTVRRANWTVYEESDSGTVTYSGQGYATGTAPDYDYLLINPVSITKADLGGRVTEQIQAESSSTSGTLAEIMEAAGGGSSAFPQSSYVRWTTTQYTDCCFAASQRVYHTIPASGEGTSGTNYDETVYGYDSMKRQNRVVTPGGTITFRVYDARGQVIETWVGTNDDGATETDPSGGGLDPDNNMVLVASAEYDHGLDGGDGNLTAQTQHVDATTTRVTEFDYDWRNRRVETDGEVDYCEVLTYDNLDRVIETRRYNTTSAGNLIAKSETKYDDRGRVYRTIRYGVDPSTGTVGNSLTDNTWFDAAGNVIKQLPAGSSLFTKTGYDSLGRASVRYSGYDLDETAYPG